MTGTVAISEEWSEPLGGRGGIARDASLMLLVSHLNPSRWRDIGTYLMAFTTIPVVPVPVGRHLLELLPRAVILDLLQDAVIGGDALAEILSRAHDHVRSIDPWQCQYAVAAAAARALVFNTLEPTIAPLLSAYPRSAILPTVCRTRLDRYSDLGLYFPQGTFKADLAFYGDQHEAE